MEMCAVDADTTEEAQELKRADSVSTTLSEFEYKRSYREVSVKRIQRKSSYQKYAREKTAFVCEYSFPLCPLMYVFWLYSL